MYDPALLTGDAYGHGTCFKAEAAAHAARPDRHGDHAGRLRRMGDRRRLAVRLGCAGRRQLGCRDPPRRRRCGINWIDTAAIYGFGHSEEVVGRALKEIPAAERPYVFTKCGLVRDPRNPDGTAAQGGDGGEPAREVEASLKRLGVERIDLMQMHWPSEDGTPIEEYWQTLLDLKREGKVRAVGLSNHDVSQLEAAETIGHVDTLQPPFSAIRRDAAAAELPWCAAHETGVIVYSPMQSGLLTGRFSVARAEALPAERLALAQSRIRRRKARPQSEGRRGHGPDCRSARDERGGGRGRLDAGLAGGHGGHRRRAQPRAGRRLARCGLAPPDRR